MRRRKLARDGELGARLPLPPLRDFRSRSRWLPANRPITTPTKSRRRSVSTSSGGRTAKVLRGSMKSEVVDEEAADRRHNGRHGPQRMAIADHGDR